MDALDLARWQFGITTVYHFLFVPLTIGMAAVHRSTADGLGAYQEPDLPSGDEVLREKSS